MDDFEIMFRDLTEETQKSLLTWAKIDDPFELNWDSMPIAIIPAIDLDD